MTHQLRGQPKWNNRPGRAFVITSCVTGATAGNFLGEPGYSYDFLAARYIPLLKGFGEVIRVADPRKDLEAAIAEVRARGLDPVHVAFLPPQMATLTSSAPNVLVLAWEFAEIPDHEFDGNPQNDWIATSEHCAMLIVSSGFTREALLRARARAPVRLIPAPVPESYLEMESWRPGQRIYLDCQAHVFPKPPDQIFPQAPDPVVVQELPSSPTLPPRKSFLKRVCRRLAQATLPDRLYRTTAAAVRAALQEYRAGPSLPPLPPPLPPPAKAPELSGVVLGETVGVELSGIVYTSILNPGDNRKNWEDLISGFIFALKDRPDATLVIKLATSSPFWIEMVFGHCRLVGVPYRCKVVVISQFLTEAQMKDLARVTTYYLTTTKAEGICLPLMDYLAAGRPAVCPCHTALQDYFGPEVGFVVESHPEPVGFPHDRKLRLLTTRQRIVWSSLVEQIRRSYDIARESLPAYEALAWRARGTLRQWASAAAVQPRLESVLAELPYAQVQGAWAA